MSETYVAEPEVLDVEPAEDSKAIRPWAPEGHRDLEELEALARAFTASGYFPDTHKISQAIVKILAGRSFGLQPFNAMKAINIIDGKPELSSTAIASLIRRHPDYEYEIERLDDEVCTIRFYRVRRGGDLERLEPGSTFSWADAERAGLATKRNWRQYPRAMLFARAMSQGARLHCPDVFEGEVYAEGEIGDTVDSDLAEVEAAAVAEADGPAVDLWERDNDRSVAMRRIHYTAGQLGVTHEELSAWACGETGAESMASISAGLLRELDQGLRRGEGPRPESIPVAPNGPHVPAASKGERARREDWNPAVNAAAAHRVQPGLLRGAFLARYGFEPDEATIAQARDFGTWLGLWLGAGGDIGPVAHEPAEEAS
ncbi:MAG TPA: hypothetical protein VM840_13530 [Actinomycetota bacterium]|nr:hypothetical protein [Actinomycetota bacterium]